jgi:hypothetical protein
LPQFGHTRAAGNTASPQVGQATRRAYRALRRDDREMPHSRMIINNKAPTKIMCMTGFS